MGRSEKIVAEGNSSNVCESEKQEIVFQKLNFSQKLEFMLSAPKKTRRHDLTLFLLLFYTSTGTIQTHIHPLASHNKSLYPVGEEQTHKISPLGSRQEPHCQKDDFKFYLCRYNWRGKTETRLPPPSRCLCFVNSPPLYSALLHINSVLPMSKANVSGQLRVRVCRNTLPRRTCRF